MENWKKLVPKMSVCVGLLIVIWGGYLFGMKKIDQTIECEREDDFRWMVQVDDVYTEENEWIVEGFAFELNKDAKGDNYEIVLRDLDTGEYVFPKMKYEERQDVNTYFLCEYDYTKSGFVAKIKKKKLDLMGKNYEVLLKVNNNRMPYRLAIYLADGEVMYTNPMENEPLEAFGTELEGVVENGILRVCRPDEGVYIYQFEGYLYWIIEEIKGFGNEERTYIDCMIRTTQPSMLPENRRNGGYTSDNRDFIFQENELVNIDLEGYRVARIKLPQEYPITSILTGHRDNDEWVWMDTFRMNCLIEK